MKKVSNPWHIWGCQIICTFHSWIIDDDSKRAKGAPACATYSCWPQWRKCQIASASGHGSASLVSHVKSLAQVDGVTWTWERHCSARSQGSQKRRSEACAKTFFWNLDQCHELRKNQKNLLFVILITVEWEVFWSDWLTVIQSLLWQWCSSQLYDITVHIHYTLMQDYGSECIATTVNDRLYYW